MRGHPREERSGPYSRPAPWHKSSILRDRESWRRGSSPRGRWTQQGRPSTFGKLVTGDTNRHDSRLEASHETSSFNNAQGEGVATTSSCSEKVVIRLNEHSKLVAELTSEPCPRPATRVSDEARLLLDERFVAHASYRRQVFGKKAKGNSSRPFDHDYDLVKANCVHRTNATAAVLKKKCYTERNEFLRQVDAALNSMAEELRWSIPRVARISDLGLRARISASTPLGQRKGTFPDSSGRNLRDEISFRVLAAARIFRQVPSNGADRPEFVDAMMRTLSKDLVALYREICNEKEVTLRARIFELESSTDTSMVESQVLETSTDAFMDAEMEEAPLQGTSQAPVTAVPMEATPEQVAARDALIRRELMECLASELPRVKGKGKST